MNKNDKMVKIKEKTRKEKERKENINKIRINQIKTKLNKQSLYVKLSKVVYSIWRCSSVG